MLSNTRIILTNTASITHQVRGAVFHGGGVVDQRPRVCIPFFGKIKPLLIIITPVAVLILYLGTFLAQAPNGSAYARFGLCILRSTLVH